MGGGGRKDKRPKLPKDMFWFRWASMGLVIACVQHCCHRYHITNRDFRCCCHRVVSITNIVRRRYDGDSLCFDGEGGVEW